MAEIKVYRTYDHYRDPVMEQVLAIVEKEGLSKKLGILSEITGVGKQTYIKWREGVTRYPRYATVMATVTGLGYQAGFRRVDKFDVEEAREAAQQWKTRQEAKKKAAKAALIAKRKAARAAGHASGATAHRS